MSFSLADLGSISLEIYKNLMPDVFFCMFLFTSGLANRLSNFSFIGSQGAMTKSSFQSF